MELVATCRYNDHPEWPEVPRTSFVENLENQAARLHGGGVVVGTSSPSQLPSTKGNVSETILQSQSLKPRNERRNRESTPSSGTANTRDFHSDTSASTISSDTANARYEPIHELSNSDSAVQLETSHTTANNELTTGEEPISALTTSRTTVPNNSFGEPSRPRQLIKHITRFPRFSLGRNQWPDPHLSLGVKCHPQGNYECWRATGPAEELFNRISKDISDVLDARVYELEEGDQDAGDILLFHMYMIGKREATARPTLLFTCRGQRRRRKAIKFIKESQILKGHPKIALAESAITPLIMGRNYVRLLAGQSRWRYDLPALLEARDLQVDDAILKQLYLHKDPEKIELPIRHNKDNDMTIPESYQKLREESPSIYQLVNNIYGLPIIASSTGRRSTIGGILFSNGLFHGLTVSHVFINSPAIHQKEVDRMNHQKDNSEFAFDEDDEDDEDSLEITAADIAATSRGSLSGADSMSSISRSSAMISTASEAAPQMAIAIETVLLYDEFSSRWSRSSQHAEPIGVLGQASVQDKELGLDWALIDLSEEYSEILPDIYERILNGFDDINTNNIPKKVENSVEVTSITGYSGTLSGNLIPGFSCMKLSPQSKFQDVWTVHFEKPLSQGDSGSWVFDSTSRQLYGHIVAGTPESCIAYIIPAFKVFEHIQQQTGVFKFASDIFANISDAKDIFLSIDTSGTMDMDKEFRRAKKHST